MKKFTFPLDSLLRFRRNRRDLCCQLLAEVAAEQRRFDEYRTSLLRQRSVQLSQLRRLGERGGVDVDRSASRRFHAGQILAELQVADRNCRALAEQSALCRQALTRADQEVKALEKLREKYRAAHKYEEARRESRELDEEWLAIHLSQGTD